MRTLAASTSTVLLLIALCSFAIVSAGSTVPAADRTATTADQAVDVDRHPSQFDGGGEQPVLSNAPGSSPSTTAGQSSPLAFGDSQNITIDLEPDGDAVLTVDFRFDVETEAQREAFEQTAEEFERTETVWPFFNNTVATVRSRSDRQMSLEGPRRSSRIDPDRGVGVLTVRMTWQRFATVSNETIVAEDAFYVDDGTPWISRLQANQRLVIVGPEGYELSGAPDGPRFVDNRIIWTGEQRFGKGDLRTTWTRTPNGLLSQPALLGVGILLVVLLVLYGTWHFSDRPGRSDDAPPAPGPSSTEPVTDTDGGAPTQSEAAGDSTADTDGPPSPDTPASLDSPTTPEEPASDSPTSDPAEASAGASGGTASADVQGAGATAATEASETDKAPGAAEASGTATEAESEDDELDRELLSDEELVERMLDRNGGRMKQANIVKETGWSNAKVSQLLSEMDEDGRIDKLRIGRENLISLPDEDVTTLE